MELEGRWNWRAVEYGGAVEYVGAVERAGAVVAAILDTGGTRWPGKEEAELFSNNLQRGYFCKIVGDSGPFAVLD